MTARGRVAPVAVTGIGVVSPLGHSVDELTQRCAAGERAATDADGGVHLGDVPFDAVPTERRARVGRLDRLSRLLLAASHLAVEDAGLDLARQDAERIGLSFGTGLGCLLSNAEFYQKIVEQGVATASPRVFAATVSSAAAGEVSIALGIHGPNATAHAGLAAGIAALGYGADLIRLGKADVVLAGGGDANGAALVAALRDMQLLKDPSRSRPFRDAVAGVWPSEGAAVVMLERADRARARGARVRACIEGHACGFEPTLTRPERRPDGIAVVLGAALAASGRAGADVGMVISGAHGTALDDCERQALRRVLGAPPVIAPKAALGETFAASAVLATALASGLFATPALAGGMGLDLAGEPAPLVLRTGAPALVTSVCYTGTVAAMVVAPAG